MHIEELIVLGQVMQHFPSTYNKPTDVYCKAVECMITKEVYKYHRETISTLQRSGWQ